jgi:pyridoxine 5-phosphate synthase
MRRLGVNIDHVATVRQARGTRYPDPIAAASYVERAGADHITIHLREDRRHIQDHDVRMLRKVVTTALNLEMACAEEIIAFAETIKPDVATFVPERRQELTTEGGLNVIKHAKKLRKAIARLQAQSIRVSLFIDPDGDQILAARELGVEAIELHTGTYCDAAHKDIAAVELVRLQEGARIAKEAGLMVCAGHGLNVENMRTVVQAAPEVEEYNIGHSIVARAMFVGLERAVQEMKLLLSS